MIITTLIKVGSYSEISRNIFLKPIKAKNNPFFSSTERHEGKHAEPE